jgi:hypothetical protein
MKFMPLANCILFMAITNPIAGEEPVLRAEPRVIQMAVPRYPSMARMSSVTGVVRFLVKTNGDSIEKIVKGEGPPMLVRELAGFLKTWKFEKHAPVEFEITFLMRRAGPSICPPAKPDEIKLILPSFIEMAFTGIMDCDPVIPAKAP